MRKSVHSAVCFVAVVLAASGAVWAQDQAGQSNGAPEAASDRPADNIALGAAYTLQPAPNYSHCTEPGDKKQLTDGEYSEGYFWTQPSTVGWRHAKPVIITIDLGEVKPIRGLSFNTAAGTAGVAWPQAICLFTADLEGQFHEVGELVALSVKHGLPEPNEYDTHRYWTDELKAHGRYVALAVYAQPYTFVDEIEVYAGEADWLDTPLPGNVITDLKTHTSDMAVQAGIRTRLVQDMQAIKALAAESDLPTQTARNIKAELLGVEMALDEACAGFGDDFRAIIPLNAWHERLLRTQAWLWQAKGLKPLTFWQSSLWEPLPLIGMPDADAFPNLEVHLMRNEYRAAAFNISNATHGPVQVTLNIAELPGGANPDYVTVHEVAWTDTSSGLPVADALIEVAKMEGLHLVRIPSGLTRQVWLTFHPVDVEPGDYQGYVDVGAGPYSAQIPLTLHVYPFDFPDEPTLHLGGWDYTNGSGRYGVTKRNRDPLIAHLRERFVDSPWATSEVLTRGVHAEDGAMTAEPDTSQFDAWLKLWPGAAQYCVFASVRDRYGDFAMGTPEFDEAVGAWAAFWANHAKAKGLDPAQLAVLLVDEPHDPSQDAIILAWAKAIREANTGIRIWEDPVYRDMSKAMEEMIDACHVLCPNRPIFLNAPQAYRDYYVDKRDQGIALEFYSCSGPARLLDPYAYYRLQAWTCWRYGAEAMYFWAFGDTGSASSWNEYLVSRNAYTPVFLDDESVTPAKELEAIREGIEDYEYFVMLEKALAEAPADGAGAVQEGRRLLDELAVEVCEAVKSRSFMWHDAEVDRTLADKARIRLLEALSVLRGK